MQRKLAALAAAAAVALGAAARAEAQTTLKVATLAPEGSSWMKLFHEWGGAIERRTGGAVKLRFYAGGIAGDERDVVRKMRIGQLDGAAVTAVGLGLIQPEVRVLEIPYLMESYEELDHARHALDADFRKKFEEKGYVLLTWGDVGPVYLFTNEEIASPDALRRMKIWAWTDDPLTRELFKAVGLNGVPLGVPDVLPSLQTGLINACYGSPLSTLALQWNTRVKYMTEMTTGQSIGATVVQKKVWDGLPADARKAILEEDKQLETRLIARIRDDNTAALQKMKSLGLKVVPTPPAVIKQFRDAAAQVATALDGKVYTREFRQRVEAIVRDFRAGKKK